MKRIFGATLFAFVLIAGLAAPAFAHSEITPNSVEAGSTVPFSLFVEDEKSDANTVKVELTFPQPLVVSDLPAAAGLTATVVGGSVGAEATGITWDGASESDVNVPFSLVVPDEAGRLQFKVLQTYDTGDVDRWIQEWPAGAPEPDNPGPVVDVVAAGTPTSQAGQSAEEHAAEHAAEGDHDEATSAEEHAAEHAENGDHDEATTTSVAAEDDSDSDDSNTGTIILVAVVVVLLVGGGIAFFVMRKKPSGGAPPPSSDDTPTPTSA
ncbi:MAG TPA: DUF1775 domain-containing protein [Acidimicrobiia bacterium]|nr:DUF1775 domain-containing protein [Acidimicrobiia bacterium]